MHGVAGLPGDWQVRETGFSGNLTGVAASPGQLVAVGQGGAIFSSGDGIRWTDVGHSVSRGSFHCVTYGNGLFVAGGTLEALMAISSDGIFWTAIQSTESIHANFGVTYGGGYFVAVGRGANPIPNCRLIVSTDGVDWQTVARPTTNTLRAVTFGNGQYVAVGDRGTIITSTDATNWTVQISGTEHLLRSVIFTGREFLAGGDSSTLLTSGDGITWSSVPFSSFDVTALATSGTAIVSVGALGAEGRAQASFDGLSWSGTGAGLPSRLNAVVHFDSGRFVAVGNSGLIVDTEGWADAPINVWTKNTDGYWHEMHWSLRHLPSWKDRSIVFTNAESKSLVINAATMRDHLDSTDLNEIILGAPEEAQNTLFLDHTGVTTPLRTALPLRVVPNTFLVTSNSAVEAPELHVNSEVIFGDDSFGLFRNAIHVGGLATGSVVQSRSSVMSGETVLGGPASGTWHQSGGIHEADKIRIAGNGWYHLRAGGRATVNLDVLLEAAEEDSVPRLTIDRGTMAVSRDFTASAGHATIDSGSLLSSNSIIGAGARLVQIGGDHRVTNELRVAGRYELQGGWLSYLRLILQGEIIMAGGMTSFSHVVFEGGTMRVKDRRYIHGSTFSAPGGTIDFQDGPSIIHMGLGNFAPGAILWLTNWTQGVDQLFVSQSRTPLSFVASPQIRFVNPSGFSPGIYSARITSTGEVVPVPRFVNYQRSGGQLVLSWPEGYRLLTATNVAGPYSLITNAISPYTASYTDPQRFFIIANEN